MKTLKMLSFALSAIVIYACQNNDMLVNNLDIQGHRGCRGLMPENTIPGFIRALESGVTTLEMDVVITQDHQVVVSHDPYFHHHISTAPNGKEITSENMLSHNIYKMSYDSISKYDVGQKPHPNFEIQRKIPAIKPTLSMVFDTVEAYINKYQLHKVQYSIELKRKTKYDGIYHPDGETFVNDVIRVLEQYDMTNRIILQCFDIKTLQILRKLRPDINLAYLIEDNPDYIQNIAKLGFVPEIYSPAYHLVDKELVEYCNTKGMKLTPWTINEVSDLERIMKLGVDGVISDYPDRAIEIYQGLKLTKE